MKIYVIQSPNHYDQGFDSRPFNRYDQYHFYLLFSVLASVSNPNAMKKLLLLLPLVLFFACNTDEEEQVDPVSPIIGSWQRLNPLDVLYGYVFTDDFWAYQWWLSPTGYEIERSAKYVIRQTRIIIQWNPSTKIEWQFELNEDGNILILDDRTFDKTIDLRPALGI